MDIGKALSDRPALKPDWGKPAVRNFREEDGNGSYRAILLPEGRDVELGNLSSRSRGFNSLPAKASQPAGSESCMWRWQHRS
jgi:hypothetical protein